VSYAYDALDRVAARTQSSTTNKFVYATHDNDPVAITDASGTVQSTYLRDPAGGLLALSEGGFKAWADANTHDDLAATFTTDGTALAGSTNYDPFGQVLTHTGPANSLGYQGEYTDPTNGRIDMHARWYTPATGSFASRDSLELDPDPSVRANRYTYAGADPLDRIDPTGHRDCSGGGTQLASLSSMGGGNCLGGTVGGIAGGIGNTIGGGTSTGRGVINHPGRRSGGGGGGGRGGGGGGGGGHRSGPTPAQIQAALAHKALITPAPRPPIENHITQDYLNKIRDQAESHVKVEQSTMTPTPPPAFTPVNYKSRTGAPSNNNPAGNETAPAGANPCFIWKCGPHTNFGKPRPPSFLSLLKPPPLGLGQGGLGIGQDGTAQADTCPTAQCYIWRGLDRAVNDRLRAAGRAAISPFKYYYNHLDISVGFCPYKCINLGFQGGHIYVSGGQKGIATPGVTIMESTTRYEEHEAYCLGGGAGTKYGIAGCVGQAKDGSINFNDREIGVAITPGGAWYGRNQVYHDWSPSWLRWD